MTLAEIRSRVQPGQRWVVENHQEPDLGPVMARVTRLSGTYGFYLAHPLGEAKVRWPPFRHITLDPDGTLHLRGTGAEAGKPFLTLTPVKEAS